MNGFLTSLALVTVRLQDGAWVADAAPHVIQQGTTLVVLLLTVLVVARRADRRARRPRRRDEPRAS